MDEDRTPAEDAESVESEDAGFGGRSGSKGFGGRGFGGRGFGGRGSRWYSEDHNSEATPTVGKPKPKDGDTAEGDKGFGGRGFGGR